MKRILFLIGFVFTLFVITIPVSASTYFSDENGKYTITASGLIPKTEYAVIIVAGDYTNNNMPIISEENIIYMNQICSDANGNIILSEFIPMTSSVGTVYISGENMPSQNGILLNDTGFGFIAGKIISYTVQNSETSVVIPSEFTEIASEAFKAAETVKKVFIPSTVVSISKTAFTSNTMLLLSPLTLPSVKGYSENGTTSYVLGDYNGDKIVDKTDFNKLLHHFAEGRTSENDDFNSYFDLNFDNEVNLLDLQVLLSFLYGAISDFMN